MAIEKETPTAESIRESIKKLKSFKTKYKTQIAEQSRKIENRIAELIADEPSKKHLLKQADDKINELTPATSKEALKAILPLLKSLDPDASKLAKLYAKKSEARKLLNDTNKALLSTAKYNSYLRMEKDIIKNIKEIREISASVKGGDANSLISKFVDDKRIKLVDEFKKNEANPEIMPAMMEASIKTMREIQNAISVQKKAKAIKDVYNAFKIDHPAGESKKIDDMHKSIDSIIKEIDESEKIGHVGGDKTTLWARLAKGIKDYDSVKNISSREEQEKFDRIKDPMDKALFLMEKAEKGFKDVDYGISREKAVDNAINSDKTLATAPKVYKDMIRASSAKAIAFNQARRNVSEFVKTFKVNTLSENHQKKLFSIYLSSGKEKVSEILDTLNKDSEDNASNLLSRMSQEGMSDADLEAKKKLQGVLDKNAKDARNTLVENRIIIAGATPEDIAKAEASTGKKRLGYKILKDQLKELQNAENPSEFNIRRVQLALKKYRSENSATDLELALHRQNQSVKKLKLLAKATNEDNLRKTLLKMQGRTADGSGQKDIEDKIAQGREEDELKAQEVASIEAGIEAGDFDEAPTTLGVPETEEQKVAEFEKVKAKLIQLVDSVDSIYKDKKPTEIANARESINALYPDNYKEGAIDIKNNLSAISSKEVFRGEVNRLKKELGNELVSAIRNSKENQHITLDRGDISNVVASINSIDADNFMEMATKTKELMENMTGKRQSDDEMKKQNRVVLIGRLDAMRPAISAMNAMGNKVMLQNYTDLRDVVLNYTDDQLLKEWDSIAKKVAKLTADSNNVLSNSVPKIKDQLNAKLIARVESLGGDPTLLNKEVNVIQKIIAGILPDGNLKRIYKEAIERINSLQHNMETVAPDKTKIADTQNKEIEDHS